VRSKSGEWYCEVCGAVQTSGDVEQQDPGWISEEERRSGPSTGPAKVQVGSSVGTPWKDEGGRWAQYNERLSYRNKRLLDSLKEIRALTTALELTDSTRDEAAVLFRKAAEKGLLQGRSVEAVAAASVYIAARRNKEPLTFTWIAEVSPVEKSKITSSYRKLLSTFGMEMRVPVPVEFVDWIGSEVELSLSIRNRAREMLDAVNDANEHVGQSPPGVAAAALYGAATEARKEITQEEVADAAGVSVVTLSRQWQTIQHVLEDTANGEANHQREA
jgi:transcription initiation factor TFIIB